MLNNDNKFRNYIGKTIQGLGTTFPKGLVLEFRMTYDKVTTY